MASPPRRIQSDRAERVEARLRARCEQMKANEQPKPLGLCHSCARIVCANDNPELAGGYLFHGDCAPATESSRPA